MSPVITHMHTHTLTAMTFLRPTVLSPASLANHGPTTPHADTMMTINVSVGGRITLIVAGTVHMTLVDVLIMLGMCGSFGCSPQEPNYIMMKGMRL